MSDYNENDALSNLALIETTSMVSVFILTLCAYIMVLSNDEISDGTSQNFLNIGLLCTGISFGVCKFAARLLIVPLSKSITKQRMLFAISMFIWLSTITVSWTMFGLKIRMLNHSGAYIGIAVSSTLLGFIDFIKLRLYRLYKKSGLKLKFKRLELSMIFWEIVIITVNIVCLSLEATSIEDFYYYSLISLSAEYLLSLYNYQIYTRLYNSTPVFIVSFTCWIAALAYIIITIYILIHKELDNANIALTSIIIAFAVIIGAVCMCIDKDARIKNPL
jgi:hypothetical protein